jgi:hypothetical protein
VADDSVWPDFASLTWMASRIPMQDALVAKIEKGGVAPEFPRPSARSRWYPQEDGALLGMVPYHGEQFDPHKFHVERDGWSHEDCDVCTTRIPPMTLCYVTVRDPYYSLCAKCYKSEVVRHLPIHRVAVWRVRRALGKHGAA